MKSDSKWSSNAGITRGIIGLVNKRQPRKPEDWGALRASLDHRGSFMATLDASRVFTLLGAKGLDIQGDLPDGKDASRQ